MAAVAQHHVLPAETEASEEAPGSNPLLNLFDSCATGLFGPCEDTCASRTVFWDPTPVRPPATDERIRSLDFSQLHDSFLESLLQEAAALGAQQDDEASQTASEPLLQRQPSSLSSEHTAPHRKRRRPLRLTRKRTPPRIRSAKVAPLSSDTSSTLNDSRSLTSTTISLADLSRANLAPPETFLHEQVRLQKDKGKGEAVGSQLCAKGRVHTLDKLREKMRLLTEVASEKATGASMKIRKARVAARVDNFVETRSLMELRMGFLSMTYGILLRWDTTKTGTGTLVVLRKMCHESFYPSASQVPATIAAHPYTAASPALPQQTIGRSNSDEFLSLDAPYCVPRPYKFAPCVLFATVVSAAGLSKKSSWTIQLGLTDAVENIHMAWDTNKSFLYPKKTGTFRYDTGDRVQWNLSQFLHIKLFENRLRRRIPRRMAGTMRVPLANLQAQPSPARCSRITLPCAQDPSAVVVLDISWRSDYAVWAGQEMEARQRLPQTVTPTPHQQQRASVVEEEENDDLWDWICHVC
jgi:hypothetical protein